MAALVLKDVVKIFPGNVAAVDGLSLEVAEGELLVLVGPSGCGKTTTLRLIAGLEQLTRGTISIAGRVVNGMPPVRRDVAMVFQSHVLYPHMSVRANLAFGLKLRKVDKTEIQQRVGETAELLGIGELLGRRAAELSGGQRQRVALGRAIVRRPRLFLFDEPLSSLDPALRGQLRAKIRRLHARLAVTTLYVTHDQTDAMTLGHRIAVVRAGRLQQVADPQTLYRRPANRFVAGLIGNPAMNFFPGRIEQRQQGLVFDGQGFTLPVPLQWKSRIQPYAGRPVVLGVRPEHVGSPAAEQVPDAPRIPAEVEAVEPVGPESYVHLRSGCHRFVSRVDAGPACRAGQQILPAVTTEHLHFFDPDSEKAVE